MSNTDRPDLWIERWDTIRHAIRAYLSKFKKRFPEANFEVTEPPARTMIVQATGTPYALIQISMSLKGDQIEVKGQHSLKNSDAAIFPEPRQVVAIETINDVTQYVYDDQRTTDTEEVAEFILGLVLDTYRMNG